MSRRVGSRWVALLVVVGACGGTVKVDHDGGSGGEGGGGPSSSSVSATGTSVVSTSVSNGTGVSSVSAVSSVGTGPMVDCLDAGSYEECYFCFAEQYPNGYLMVNKLFGTYCLCGPGAPCEMVCSGEPICTDIMQGPSPPCQQCIDEEINSNGHPCVQQAIEECVQDPECEVFLNGVQGC
jgi:hypothetical protein